MADTAQSPQIVTLPALDDNYAFLLHDPTTGATAVVDVPESGPIQDELAKRGWTLTHILITHHHHDHIGDVVALQEATGAKVWGAEADAHRLPPLDEAVAHADKIHVGNLEIDVIDVPGHTIGHIALYVPAAHAVFTADSLMALGCGRLFEGTAEQMWESLQKLAALPPETLVFSSHEYTASNGRFALTIEPDNSQLISRVEAVTHAREAGQPTVPSRLSEELETNPFLRAAEPAIQERLGMRGAAPVDVFAKLRAMKDAF